MSREVRYDAIGPASVLTVIDGEPELPGPGKVRVQVKAAGLNPIDYKTRRGDFAPAQPASFPARIGRELAGVIEAVGEGVSGFVVGDEVFGNVAEVALADLAVTNPRNLARRPRGLPWEVAACLPVAGQTAFKAVEALDVTRSDTVLVSAAAGGVGSIIAQLVRLAGAHVIGTASAENQDYLAKRGIIPVAYGAGLAERVLEVAPSPVSVVFDQHGEETLAAAVQLGVDPLRVNTIAADPLDRGFSTVGRGAIDTSVLDALASLVVDGSLVVEIDGIYPLDDVVEAYQRLESGHVRGKIVIVP
jgi:NADPH:quinone reductase-like Zn-dependent oxidoreductase